MPARARNGREPGPFGRAGQAGRAAAVARELLLIDVDDNQERLGGEELKAAQPLQVVAFQVQRPERAAVLERRATQGHHVAFALEIGGAVLLQILFDPLESTLGHAQVGQDQLVFHRLCVARRIDRPRRVRDRGVVEGADDMDERIGILVPGDVDQRLGAARCRPAPPGP